MNPIDFENSEPNYWLSCLIIDKEAMCKQVRGEQDVCYVKKQESLVQQRFWKRLHLLMLKTSDLETNAYAADLSFESICCKRWKWTC